ncbi:MAG TPA: hypothetical protein VK603_02000 [Candidatus Saccharimonadales bacterium]|nr:hypothetical protein [Candidatus Saccharimonadales bacterium]
MKYHMGWRLGRILPCLLVVAFLLDIAARFIPLEGLTFRAWEALIRFRAPCGPFKASALYDEPRTYGDLAALGNLPHHRVYRHESFTTDSHGFRRNSAHPNAIKEYKILIVGDSMAVGSTVSDHETLPARLERKLGFGVYNGAGGIPIDLPLILSLAQRLKMDNGTVIYPYVGRSPLGSTQDYKLEMNSDELRRYCDNWQNRFSVWFNGFITVSPLEIIAQKTIKHLHNDSIFPNVLPTRKVVKKSLRDGDSVLFFQPEIENYQRKRLPDVRGIAALADGLRKHNLNLVVVLVPDKYVVYSPLVQNTDPDKIHEPVYLDLVEELLREAQIPVINLVRFLRQKAHEYYEKKEFIYWPDDTHWNTEGIRLSTEEILRQYMID